MRKDCSCCIKKKITTWRSGQVSTFWFIHKWYELILLLSIIYWSAWKSYRALHWSQGLEVTDKISYELIMPSFGHQSKYCELREHSKSITSAIQEGSVNVRSLIKPDFTEKKKYIFYFNSTTGSHIHSQYKPFFFFYCFCHFLVSHFSNDLYYSHRNGTNIYIYFCCIYCTWNSLCCSFVDWNQIENMRSCLINFILIVWRM